MKVLNLQEVEVVSGGFSVFGITEIETGLKLLAQVNAVASAGLKVFAGAYAFGTGISYGYEWLMGDSIGGDLYDFFHC